MRWKWKRGGEKEGERRGGKVSEGVEQKRKELHHITNTTNRNSKGRKRIHSTAYITWSTRYGNTKCEV